MSTIEVEKDMYQRSADDAWSAFIRTRFESGGDLGHSGRAARLSRLEVELETMQKYFAVAKRHMNACTGAGSLPPEILGIIFSFAQEHWQPTCIYHWEEPRGSPPRISYGLGWIYLTHVCSSWRKAALGTSSLWQTIKCSNLPLSMSTDILTRSARLPLRLYVGSYHKGTSYDEVENWLSWPILRRTSLLHIENPSVHREGTQDSEGWFAILMQPMPILESLSISSNVDDEPIRLPDDFWTNNRPMLTNLRLRNCLLPNWNTPVLSDLITELSLQMKVLYDGDRSLPTTTEVRDIFRRLTSLKSLSLENFWPRMDLPSPDPFDFYPTLEYFDFTFSMQSSMYKTHYTFFWSHFKVPAVTALSIEGHHNWDEDEDNLFRLVEPFLSVDDVSSPAMELVLNSTTILLSYVEQPLKALKSPSWHLPYHAQAHRTQSSRLLRCKDSVVKILSPLLPLNSLKTIFVAADAMKQLERAPPDGGWSQKLGAARSVTRISTHFPQCLSLLEALVEKDVIGNFALFPLLETLVLHKDTQVNIAVRSTSVDIILLELLAIRLEHNAPIRELLVDWRLELLPIWSKVDRNTTKVSFFKP
ncbi:hypothetical protein PENSPDRAFT_751079 [Peniophora sp. CONT]|nr:hypothetical protein PENSPDRAFT_751079 [Peniophora sp. CONT]